ncbi:hypothetical protein DN068_05365 [Taibaiella soli]|uniref:HTTM domain-containing protein n=2 Tax=Taibaiella soli TaxID=1649169 RepID=A0A2W2AER3_9BACT|nr:hypothetical protein DN068_05365 [Taibaiella soli]
MENDFSGVRVIITRTVVLSSLVFLLWRLYSGIMPHQLAAPAIFKLDYDFSFWTLKLAGIPDLITGNKTAGIVFSILLFLTGILSFRFPTKRICTLSYAVLYLVYAITFNIYLCHGSNYQAGFAVILFAFAAGTDDNFSLWWRTMRYYACFIYATCFIWKIAHGAIWDWNHGLDCMKLNLAEYLYHYPQTFMSGIYVWFIQHPALVNIGDKLVFIAEGTFLLGFFTKKYDRLLIFSAVFIFLSIYLFADVFFLELLIIALPFITAQYWLKAQHLRPAT